MSEKDNVIKESLFRLASIDLLACPFCGSCDIEKRGRGFYAPVQTYQRICLGCGVSTKEFYSSSEADAAWNTRAS